MTVTFLNLVGRSSEPRSRTFADEDEYVAWLNSVSADVEIISVTGGAAA